MKSFLHGYRDRSEAEQGWLEEVFQRVTELLIPVAPPTGDTAELLSAAVVTRVDQLAGCSLSLPLSYRFVSISELVSRQRTACCSNLSWSTNQHREWVREAVQALPNHRALQRANLLLIGCLTAEHGSGKPCDGSWRVKDASGSLHCELLHPSPLWLGTPMIFPCWNYIPYHAAGQHHGEAGYLELTGSPLPLTSHPKPGLALDSRGAELCNAVGVREASALIQHRCKGRRLQVLGNVSAVCPLLDIAGKPFFCLQLQEEKYTLPVLITDPGCVWWRCCVSVGQKVCVSGLRVCALRCWSGNRVLTVTAMSTLTLLDTHTSDTHCPDTYSPEAHTHTLDDHSAETGGSHSEVCLSQADTHTTPDQDTRTTPDQDTHTTPDQDTHTTPDQDTHTTPDQDTHTTPDQDTHTTPDQDTHTTSEEDAHTTPDQDTHTTPDQDTHTTPDQDTRTTPDQDTHTTPDQDTHTTPDQDTHTTPDQDTHTTPDQDTHTTSEEDAHTTPDQDTHTTPDQDTHTPSEEDAHTALDVLRNKFSRVISYKGVVTSVLSEGAGLYVIDWKVGLCLAYQPLARHGLRPGAEIELCGVHFLYRPSPTSLPSMLCACLRSSLQITAFSRLVPSNPPSNHQSDWMLPRLLFERNLGVSKYLWLCNCCTLLRERLVPSLVREEKLCVVGGRLLEHVFPLWGGGEEGGEEGGGGGEKRDIYCEMLQEPHHCLLTEYQVCVPGCEYVSLAECVRQLESWASFSLHSILEGKNPESLIQAELNPALTWSYRLTAGAQHHPLPLLLVGLLELPPVHTRSSSHLLRLRDQTGDVACVVTDICNDDQKSQRSVSNTAWIGCLVCVKRFTMVTERFLRSEFPSYKHLDQNHYIKHRHCRVYLQFCLDDVHIISPSSSMRTLLEIDREKERGEERGREGGEKGKGEDRGREVGGDQEGCWAQVPELGRRKRKIEGGKEERKEGGLKKREIRQDPAPDVAMEMDVEGSLLPSDRACPVTSAPCVSVVMRVEWKEGLAWKNVVNGSEGKGAGLSLCFSVRAQLIGPVQRWGRDPRNTPLLEKEKDREVGRERVELLFAGAAVRWFPVLQTGSLYRLISPNTQDTSVLIGSCIAGQSGVQLHTCPFLLVCSDWRIHSIPHPLLTPSLPQVCSRVLSVSHVLDGSSTGDLVSCQVFLTERINMQEKTGLHTHSTHPEVEVGLTVRLTVCDVSSRGRSLQVYLDLGHAPYPLGLLPGNTLLLERVQRRTSRVGCVYCRSLPVSCVTVMALGSTHTQCVEPLPIILLGDWAVQRAHLGTMGKVRGHLVCILFLKLQWTCSLCGCLYAQDRCTRQSPPCLSRSAVFQANAKASVEDGSGEAHVWFPSLLVSSLLRLAPPQWEGLQRSVRIRGHLSVSLRGQDSDEPLQMYLSAVCGSNYVCRPVTLTCHLNTHSHTPPASTEDIIQLKTFTRGEREFVTRLPQRIKLTCTHLEEEGLGGD